jgi:hypothetical protein
MKVDVLLPGSSEITQMDDSELLKLEGGGEDADAIYTWVQYHLPINGVLVHRSAHVHLKLPAGAVGQQNL